AHPASHGVARPSLVWIVPRPGCSRQRTGGAHFMRRRRFFLGAVRQALARCATSSSPCGDCLFLRHSPPVVRPLRPPQSGLFSRLHRRSQFQALLHSRIPAHPAVLVLPACAPRSFTALDSGRALGRGLWNCPSLAHAARERIHVAPVMLGGILHRVFFRVAVQTSGLHSSRSTSYVSIAGLLAHDNGKSS